MTLWDMMPGLQSIIDKQISGLAESSGWISVAVKPFFEDRHMRVIVFALAGAVLNAPLAAQTKLTADDIIARYVKTVGGADKIQAVNTIRRVGRFTGDDGFQAIVIEESTRPNKVREEFSVQGMTAINAYDGANGWKIDPFGGKKDAEALSEAELRSIVEDADFDEPLINYKAKGNKVEFVGMDQVEGTDVYKLKVTLKSGDTRYYYMDTDSYVPIKFDTRRIIRGTPQESETILGDYKQVGGWFLPFSMETRQKGSSGSQKITIDKIEINVPIDESRYTRPKPPTSSGGGGSGAGEQGGRLS
ncbi:MAG TPA: hypothetical protein VE110_13295 [Gemmatimonadaceae bacterium]|nr:hypothetical protein [Gemmatimonadaceae bacterium]